MLPILKEVMKSSLQYDICELYKWDECLHSHSYRWGGEAEAQMVRKWPALPFPRKGHQLCWKMNPVCLCVLVPSSIHQVFPAFLDEELCAAAVLAMHCLYLQICLTLFSQHSIFSLTSDISSFAAQPDTSFYIKNPVFFPFIPCPPVSFMPLIIQALFWF